MSTNHACPFHANIGESGCSLRRFAVSNTLSYPTTVAKPDCVQDGMTTSHVRVPVTVPVGLFGSYLSV